MPAANPLSDVIYNTGQTSGMNSGTTHSSLASGARSGAAAAVAGNTNITVAALVGGSLIVLLAFHLLGFRFAFDVSVGRK
jgi:hypothetical protein